MDRLMVSVSGVRGMIGGTLTPQVACEFGCAFAAMLGAGKKVTVGRDTRTSGPMIRNAVAAGLLAGGVHVVDLGVVSTPGAAFMTARLGCDGGVVITASHNPIEYNGIKFLQPTGTGLSAGDAERLKQIWQARQWTFAGPLEQGEETRDGRTAGQHVGSVLSAVDVFAIADKRFKVVLDSVNGAGCVEAPVLLGKLGCEYKHLNAEGTGRFAHPPEPVEENLRELCQAVKAHRAAVGFAQDADADRLAIVDENGAFIGEEYTLALATAFVLRKRKGAIATNLATSRMVDDIAAAAGCRVVRSPTGEANVVDAMCREGCIFGGEGGGGVIEPRVVPVRDSLVGMAYLLQQMADTGKTVSQLVAEIPRYVMVKTKQPCPQEAVADILAAAREAFADDADVRFNDQDGLRIDLAQAWVSVRASNTEPIIRVMGEAPDRATIETLIQRVRSVVQTVLA